MVVPILALTKTQFKFILLPFAFNTPYKFKTIRFVIKKSKIKWSVQDGNLNDCKACDSDRRTCSPIPVPEGDPFFPSEDPKTKAPRCLKFVRFVYHLN